MCIYIYNINNNIMYYSINIIVIAYIIYQYSNYHIYYISYTEY